MGEWMVGLVDDGCGWMDELVCKWIDEWVVG